MSGPLLDCKDVDVSYGPVRILFGVDFEVREGEIVALLGTNGAGKSTLLKAVCGLVKPKRGKVVFDGEDVTNLPADVTTHRGISLMPGGKGVFPTLTVLNLALGDWLGTLGPVVRTFVLATIAVPIVIYGLMPRLHKLRVRLLTRGR